MATIEEADVDEIYQKIKEQEEDRERNTTNKMPIDVRAWFAFALGAIALTMLLKWIEIKTGIIVGIILIVIFKFLYGDFAGKRELTEQELAILCYKKLRYKQINMLGDFYQIPQHQKIQVEKIGRRVRVNGKPMERIYGVSIYDPRNYSKEWYRVAMDLFTGDILAMRKLPAGFIDLEDWDVKVIMSEQLKETKRYYKNLGISPPRRPPTQ